MQVLFSRSWKKGTQEKNAGGHHVISAGKRLQKLEKFAGIREEREKRRRGYAEQTLPVFCVWVHVLKYFKFSYSCGSIFLTFFH